MTDNEKLEQAIILCDEVIDLLDRLYLSHCYDVNITPDPKVLEKYMAP